VDASRSRESLLIGLSFGQVGAVVVWAFLAANITWQRIAACYAMAVVMSQYFMFCESRSNADAAAAAMVVTLWCAFATLALAANFALRWLRHQRRRAIANDENEQPPRFSVRQLLIVTTVLAVASMIVRLALPELRSANHDTIVVWLLQSAMLTVVAVELVRRQLPLFFQLGGLAVAGIAGTACLQATVDWDDAVFANAVQLAILALAMVVPQLDRYKVTVELEPRDGASEPESLDHLVE
jgi:hypothetical protein